MIVPSPPHASQDKTEVPGMAEDDHRSARFQTGVKFIVASAVGTLGLFVAGQDINGETN